MAISNRDRVGQMFDAVGPALNEFITRVLSAELPAGHSWTQLVALRDQQNGITGKTYEPGDPQVQLRMLTENIPHQVKAGWRPFEGQLSAVQRSYASELRDARNGWAHNRSFSDDDAYRVLDTAERLLTGISSPEAAEKVKRIRLNLRRVTADKDDKRTLKTLIENPESAGLRPWREVLQPHDDVATGNFQAAEFAADLYKVALGRNASKDYADPVEFFSRTYLTEGLRDLIVRAVKRLSGDENASPVINLQTNFGGGKTHSMLSLWHLAAGEPLGSFPQELQELLVEAGYDKLAGSNPRRVAIVGNHTSPSGDVKPNGTKVNTLWGELAWQLGGPQAYELVRAADESRTPPGPALHTLLQQYAPAVILIDEWVAYARSLVGREDLAGGTFDDQFTFAQALTEAAKGTPGVLLAISIPASHSGDDAEPVAGSAEEVGGEHGLQALKRLQNVVRRVADQWRPASSDEAYHIVRQRLFVQPDGAALASMRATARAFVEYYRKYDADFPREARDNAYETRIESTYPIHPELFDRLYEDWSSLERFQRTRGVLRLMNTIIHALWVGEDKSPLIMPGSIPIATATVNAELTQYLQDSWKAVIDADVDGLNSEPAKIDTEKPLFGQRSLTKRLARTVFFGAAPTIGSAQKGLETQRVFLGTATPGDVPGNFHSALNQLGDRGTYFYSGQGKYWYDLQANISRRAKDQAERLHREDVWAEIVRRLADQARTKGNFGGVHVCPEATGDIPDTDEARLVILHPKTTHAKRATDSTAIGFARKATDGRGSANRTYRNMLSYLAADHIRMGELDTAVRDYLGWSDVLASHDLDLTDNQKNQANEKKRQADNTIKDRLLLTYVWALVPEGQPVTITETKVEGQLQSLAERVSKKLGNDGALTTQQAPAVIRHVLDTKTGNLWADGHLSVGDLWKLYASYAYMPRLRDRSVLTTGLTTPVLLWQQDGFALADGYEDARYRGLWLPTDDSTPHVIDSTLIVRPEVAEAQRLKEQPAPDPDPLDPEPKPGPGPRPEHPVPAPPKTETGPSRFFGTRQLDPSKYALDFKRINDEILAHLAAAPGVTLRVTVEIEAESDEGFDPGLVRTVSENANTLKFEQASFEDQ